MAYVKKNWQNTPSTNTPVNADNLNHMEQVDEQLSRTPRTLPTMRGTFSTMVAVAVFSHGHAHIHSMLIS